MADGHFPEIESEGYLNLRARLKKLTRANDHLNRQEDPQIAVLVREIDGLPGGLKAHEDSRLLVKADNFGVLIELYARRAQRREKLLFVVNRLLTVFPKRLGKDFRELDSLKAGLENDLRGLRSAISTHTERRTGCLMRLRKLKNVQYSFFEPHPRKTRGRK